MNTVRQFFLAAKIEQKKCGSGKKLKSAIISRGFELLVCTLAHTNVSYVKNASFRKGGLQRWTLSQPPCSAEFAATSTSSSEHLSPLRFSSWCTEISSASGLCHGSPTSLIDTHTHTHNNCELQLSAWGNKATAHSWLKLDVADKNCAEIMLILPLRDDLSSLAKNVLKRQSLSVQITFTLVPLAFCCSSSPHTGETRIFFSTYLKMLPLWQSPAIL